MGRNGLTRTGIARHSPRDADHYEAYAAAVGRLALSPLDLELRFGLTGGDIFHGKMGLDQLFPARPMLGHVHSSRWARPVP